MRAQKWNLPYSLMCYILFRGINQLCYVFATNNLQGHRKLNRPIQPKNFFQEILLIIRLFIHRDLVWRLDALAPSQNVFYKKNIESSYLGKEEKLIVIVTYPKNSGLSLLLNLSRGGSCLIPWRSDKFFSNRFFSAILKLKHFFE